MRKYVLHEFKQIFVNDRPFQRGVINTQTNTQSKTEFSNAMTVMDKIDGWEDEEKWVGSRCGNTPKQCYVMDGNPLRNT